MGLPPALGTAWSGGCMAGWCPHVGALSSVCAPMASSMKCSAMASSVGEASLCVSEGVACASSCRCVAQRSGWPTLEGSLQPIGPCVLEPCRLVHQRVVGLWLPAGLAGWLSEEVPVRGFCFFCVSCLLIPPAAASKMSWRLQCPLPAKRGCFFGVMALIC